METTTAVTVAAAAMHKKAGSVGSGSDRSSMEREGSESDREGGKREVFVFFGWVYHLGVNSIGHEYCHLRFLFIRGKYVEMYKRDPHESPGIQPIRRGVVGLSLMVEDLGRRKVNHGDLYVLRFYSRLDETKKGEIACATAGEVQKWMEAFDLAKQQAEYELSRGGSARNKLSMETEITLEGHRHRVRRYANELKKLIRIGQGPEMLLSKSSSLGIGAGGNIGGDVGDAIEANEWKCIRTMNGIRIFEDVAESKMRKGVLVKSVGVVDACADTVFEVLLNLERQRRYEWDPFTSDLELVESYDGHYDVVYGTYDPKYLTRWQSKRDFVFSRQWFHAQDGTYTILQLPVADKKRPPKSGYRRTTLNPSTWEIRSINAPMGTNIAKCLVTQTLEIYEVGWTRWKNNHCSKFEKTIPYALMCQVSGLKEYIEANPSLKVQSSMAVVQSKVSDVSISNSEYEEKDVRDEFYDAISADSSSEEEESDDEEPNHKAKVRLKNVSWAIASLALKKSSDGVVPSIEALDHLDVVIGTNKDLDHNVTPATIDPSNFPGSLRKGKDDSDTNCWASPSGAGFMIRGKNYLKDNTKVIGGDPLLKLLAVDWLKVDEKIDRIALHPNCLVQSEAGKKLPFILVINLQIPARPNYSLVTYYASDRPVKKDSLLGNFVDGSDAFRDSRFKLIPSIVEGYWMVKRAVGTKACLLGKAVTCKYLRQDNFLEIDVDIGSSSVARSVIGLVLGYVTSIVVDLAILVEAKEESELPEYILGTVRLNRLTPDSALHFGA
ncbi:protein ENHANCED DISEASE RESISTANCE 2 isoform X1 [Syzygium oleosum]|uniref:protein ENHANCED DISEASE RESISTANCE 2 isoform X1 n=1 Tax=Syzygium oleosum TaxID=219896 RepID=UPI0024B8F721|nr:protein ENHANCED DISEASE RESISTANCE 2 isoform X1 [Syzygium oleosum]